MIIKSAGAGDAFVGSFVHYLNRLGDELVLNAVELASEYASITVQYPGTQSSYPKLEKLSDKFSV